MSSHISLVLIILLLIAMSSDCHRADEQMRPIGPDVSASFVVYFKSKASEEDINAFKREVLSRPHPEGRGRYNPEGVYLILRVRPVQGHEAIAVTFSADATMEQREKLIGAVKASPFVYRVLEHVAPGEVKTIEEAH